MDKVIDTIYNIKVDTHIPSGYVYIVKTSNDDNMFCVAVSLTDPAKIVDKMNNLRLKIQHDTGFIEGSYSIVFYAHLNDPVGIINLFNLMYRNIRKKTTLFTKLPSEKYFGWYNCSMYNAISYIIHRKCSQISKSTGTNENNNFFYSGLNFSTLYYEMENYENVKSDFSFFSIIITLIRLPIYIVGFIPWSLYYYIFDFQEREKERVEKNIYTNLIRATKHNIKNGYL